MCSVTCGKLICGDGRNGPIVTPGSFSSTSSWVLTLVQPSAAAPCTYTNRSLTMRPGNVPRAILQDDPSSGLRWKTFHPNAQERGWGNLLHLTESGVKKAGLELRYLNPRPHERLQQATLTASLISGLPYGIDTHHIYFHRETILLRARYYPGPTGATRIRSDL